MEVADSVVVSRTLPVAQIGAGRASTLITRIRSLVREARAASPELAGYHLQDVGLRRSESALEVRLYFHR